MNYKKVLQNTQKANKKALLKAYTPKTYKAFTLCVSEENDRIYIEASIYIEKNRHKLYIGSNPCNIEKKIDLFWEDNPIWYRGLQKKEEKKE